MLIGPDAPLALAGPRMTRPPRCTTSTSRTTPEYATVDGKLSQNAYLTAVDRCRGGAQGIIIALGAASAPRRHAPTSTPALAHACLHSPYNKLASAARGCSSATSPTRPPGLDFDARGAGLPLRDVATCNSDRAAESAFRAMVDGRFKAMCGPSDTISRAVGNCYTAAVYMNLLSLVANVGAALEEGPRAFSLEQLLAYFRMVTKQSYDEAGAGARTWRGSC